MLTRLRVNGFKNLVDVDVRFGPFTCIAGANGVGKSNLFDAIHFLSALADRPLIDAALSVRDEGGRTADVRSLFHRVGDEYADEMSFEAEMIVPKQGIDDLGQMAEASITFLKYSLSLAYRKTKALTLPGTLEITKEELVHINQQDAHQHLWFPHNASQWRKTAVTGQRRVPYFISTDPVVDGNRIIKLHQDGGISGRPLSRLAANLPRTILSVANAAESPTALLARREMQSWRLLQLEPSALRKPDEFTALTKLGTDGSNLAATLYHLEEVGEGDSSATGSLPKLHMYGQIANRLSELIRDVREVSVERDDKRELLTLYVTGMDGTPHPARALSDGTLRFLALAVIELDSETQGVLCLEEPENGIHPERIPAMIELLQDISTNVNEPISSSNPLRQVIINTHSPSVVMQVDEDSLLVAELKETINDKQRFKRVCFSGLPDTWRHQKTVNGGLDEVVSKGKLLAYLRPISSEKHSIFGGYENDPRRALRKPRRVIDRPDLQLLLPLQGIAEADPLQNGK